MLEGMEIGQKWYKFSFQYRNLCYKCNFNTFSAQLSHFCVWIATFLN